MFPASMPMPFKGSGPKPGKSYQTAPPRKSWPLFDLRAPHVFKNRNLHNPMGVMLTTIKAWFTAQKVLQMRERAQQEAEETARILRELEEFKDSQKRTS